MYDYANGDKVHCFARWNTLQPLNGIVRARLESPEGDVVFKVEVMGEGKPDHLDFAYVPKGDCRPLG